MGKLSKEEKELRQFRRWKKTQESKLSKQELEEIKELEKEALGLWKKAVRKRAKGKCEVHGDKCKKSRKNAHHVEAYATNKFLRYDPRNGVYACVTAHKFGKLSFQKSLCFSFEFMAKNRKNDFVFLLKVYKEDIPITKGGLEAAIKHLKMFLDLDK